MFGDAFWSVYHWSNRMRFRSKTMPNRGQTTWSFSSFASFSSLTMNVHWRCSSTHISYTVTCTSRPLFCNSFFTHRLSLLFVLHDRRCDGVSPSGCYHRRNGGDQLAERASRVAVAHLHDRDALARHGVTQLHARIYQRAVSVSNQKHRMHPQTQLADMTPLVSLSNLFVVLCLHHKGQSLCSPSLAVNDYALTSIYWEILAKNHKNLINGAQAS